MLKMFSVRPQEGIKLEFTWLTFGLFFILFFTSLNGFVDSIDYEYGATDSWQCTFLGDPNDRHADLIKLSISTVSSPPPNLSEWPSHYLDFYTNNPYGNVGAVSRGRLTAFHSLPLALLVVTGIGNGILLTGPVFTTIVFYAVALTLLWLACWYFVSTSWERIFAFSVLALGYPFMVILSRANVGSLVAGFALIFYIYLCCNRRHLLIAGICLAVACNVRPNAVLLAPLFLCFGLRKSIGGVALFLLMAGAIASVCYAIAVKVYPGYSFSVFLQALDIYQSLYVFGSMGDGNNNSAYGALKVLYEMLLIGTSPRLLTAVNQFILLLGVGFIAFASYRFWRGLLPAYYFAFVITGVYILASTVIATYHMFVLYVFILAAGCKTAESGTFPSILVLMAALILIPKNYIYMFPGVSCEVILNPLILSICLGWILSRKFPVQTELSTEDSMRTAPEVRTKKRRR